MSKIAERLSALRQAMLKYELDAYIIPSNDPHQSEYVAPHWKSREWISGFTGSAGIAIVTRNKAGLWTDGRYFVQAEAELEGTEFKMYPLLGASQPEYIDWLLEELSARDTLGLDGQLVSQAQYRRLSSRLEAKGTILNSQHDLFHEAWQDRPALPTAPIWNHSLRYNGESRAAKLGRIRQKMQEAGAEAYLISKLDEIAWVCNLRGKDVAYNPVFLAYLLIQNEGVVLFIDQSKVSETIQSSLAEDNIQLAPYSSVDIVLEELSKEKKIMLESSLNLVLLEKVVPTNQVKGAGMVERMKAIKNSTEADHLKETMVKDGVALVRLYRWLEKVLPSGIINEYDIAMQLIEFREKQDLYIGESFSAIVGFKGNGAIIHYRPDEKESSIVSEEGMLLIDSGGQYQDGTTDITRTIYLGTPSQEQKEAFTNVLKGHIALAVIHFPAGTSGGQLDVLARAALWKSGLNYAHGTGHGVGFCLNVHEGPHGISTHTASAKGKTSIAPGMLTSNEPGYYKEGEYGIRIENLILCVESEYAVDGDFFKFETLTLFPIDQNLIDIELLTQEEIDWLNNYHSQVYQKLSPHLEEEECAWLEAKCQQMHNFAE